MFDLRLSYSITLYIKCAAYFDYYCLPVILQMTLPKKVNPMKTTVGSLEGVVPCENRNVTFLMVTIMLPDSFGSLCFVLFVQNLCGKC